MHAIRAPFLDFVQNPYVDNDNAIHFESDGLIVIEDGKIKACGPWSTLKHQFDTVKITQYTDKHLIIPGFIDLHCHYPQATMVGSWGNTLLDWLNDYTFPAELKFSNPDYARDIAKQWVNICIDNGITTPVSFCTVHPASVDAFFEATQVHNMCAIGGKVMMDRNAPAGLLDTPQSAYDDSQDLIQKWHNKDRLHYAITPRFAGTSTEQQLEACQALWKSRDDLYLQSHISENIDEISWTKNLFPKSSDYLNVYEQYELLGPRAIYAHGVHLTNSELQRFRESQSVLAHCPSSNLFLGSGMLDIAKILENHVRFGIGTDIGAGTSYSPFHTLNAMYQTARSCGAQLTPTQAIWSMTSGAAQALTLGNTIGHIRNEFDADFIVLDSEATPALALRMSQCSSFKELLGAYCTLGDDRTIAATYIAGKNQKNT